MSLVTKTNPVGVDKKIDSLQRKLYSSLIADWGINTKYNCTPRCYRNQSTDSGYTAELFTGGVDYKELYLDDTIAATSFFGVGQDRKVSQDNMTTADVHLIFSVNLDKIKPSTTQRTDEEAILDVQKVIDTTGISRGWQIIKITTGLDKILNEYPGSKKEIGLKYKDMHPFLWFRFDLQVYYQPTQTQCSHLN